MVLTSKIVFFRNFILMISLMINQYDIGNIRIFQQKIVNDFSDILVKGWFLDFRILSDIYKKIEVFQNRK